MSPPPTQRPSVMQQHEETAVTVHIMRKGTRRSATPQDIISIMGPTIIRSSVIKADTIFQRAMATSSLAPRLPRAILRLAMETLASATTPFSQAPTATTPSTSAAYSLEIFRQPPPHLLKQLQALLESHLPLHGQNCRSTQTMVLLTRHCLRLVRARPLLRQHYSR